MSPHHTHHTNHHLVDGHRHQHGPHHLLARLGWDVLGRRQVHRLDRRRFVADLGKGTFAMAILGVAGCASGSTESSEAVAPSSTAASSDTATSGTTTASSDTATSSNTTTAAADPTAAPDEPTDDASLAWEQVSLGFVSAYVLVRGNTAAIADSGTPGSSEAIGAGLATLGVTYDDVDHVILTHAHGDHVGSLPEIIELAGSATVHAGGADIPSITSPVPIQAVGDGDDVFGLQVFNTPGHTPGSISLFDPGIGLLVAGDAINTNADGTEVTGANERFSTNMGLANSSVIKLAELEPDALAVGHGGPVTSGAAPLLTELASSL